MTQRITLQAQIAQLVEQRTENPRVTGSIPVLGTFIFLVLCKLKFIEFFSFYELGCIYLVENDNIG